MGRSLSLAPDLDGDQVADMIVGSARQSPTRPSALTAFGTRDGRELFSLECQTAGRSFGDELAFADIDADGARDILVGELSDAADAPPEYVAAYSGKDRSLLRRASSDKARFGYRICGVGDVNRDGCEDYAVACEGWLAVGRTWLLSGKDGAELFDWKEESGVCDPHIGVSMAAPGDVDGDGVPDVFLGVVNQAAPGCPGEGRMLSGRTGELIWAQTKAAALAGKVASPRAPK